MLSIIIPTLNEEINLTFLLESIKKQGLDNYEVLVADAGSTDRTREIARKYNCRIVSGGLPARGRNEGAKVARGDILLFLDADLVLGDGFLRSALKEFKIRGIDAASFCLEPNKGSTGTKLLLDLFYNWPIRFSEKFLPPGAQAILVKRAIHEHLGGFDEEIKLAEDHEYMRRASDIGRYAILRSDRVYISLRRFETDGWAKTYLKFLMVELHMVLFGAVKSDRFKYRFGHYGGSGK